MVVMPRHHNLSQPILMVTHNQDMDNRAATDSSRVDTSNQEGINSLADISNPVDTSNQEGISSPADINRDRMERLLMVPRVLWVLPLWACNPTLKLA